jgi:trk system potassium uptake protein TrkA
MGVHAIVVGCGRVGSELAAALERSGHSVAIIDKNRRAFRRLPDDWKGERITGYGFDRDHLEEAGASRASALAAVTNGDNSNVLSARIARETYQIPNVVARIYDPRRAAIYQRLGIPTVATVPWTTDQVMRRLFPDEGATEWTDPTGRFTLLERGLPERWAGRKLASLVNGSPARLVLVTRAGEARIAGPELVGQEGDTLTFLAPRDGGGDLDQQLGLAAMSRVH